MGCSWGKGPPSESLESSGPPGVIPHARKVNDSLYELYKSLESPTMQIIFFHGLHSEDEAETHLSTWKSGDGSCIWPQTWLKDKFPGAQVFCVSYTSRVKKRLKKSSGVSFDMYNIGENLVADILTEDIGQASYCPVILVGHCFGGLVIKQLCLDSLKKLSLSLSDDRGRLKLEKFLKSIRGVFYYGTPHHGSPLMDKSVDQLESPLLTYFKMLSDEVERLNFEFDRFRNLYKKLSIHGLGETQSAKSGLFKDHMGAPEATSRAGDIFYVVETDHVHICRPPTDTDRRFYGLTTLLDTIATDVKEEEEEARVREAAEKEEAARLSQNFPRLPKQLIGIDIPIRAVEDKLVNARTLRLVGMGGRGKTTLAKAVFNKPAVRFEYSSFVLEVKLISGGAEDVKKAVWSQMHHDGKQMQKEPNWSVLKGKSVLLILDDVSNERDLEVLFDIAEDSARESRFIVTSRDWELVKALDDIYEVPLLSEDFAKELFRTHAFPRQAAPPELEHLVGAIVEKCDGLPLTLEVIGKYLHTKKKREDWEQTVDALHNAEAVAGLNEKLWLKLKLSFDGLEPKEQEMFLDVANFFCRHCTLREAKIAWKAAYAPVSERLLWRTLVDRSLVYDVKEEDIIQMHEQMLSLGRRIGAEEGRKRRVYNHTEAMELLQSTSEHNAKEIFALRFDVNDWDIKEFRIASSVLLGLREVRYLDINGNVTIDGAEEDELVPSLFNLVFFKFQDLHSKAAGFDFGYLSRLVFLELSFFSDACLPDSITKLSSLKFLNVLGCEKIEWCDQNCNSEREGTPLTEVLPQGCAWYSRSRYCIGVRSLPESFGNLSALSNLQFDKCNLLSLPESFGKLSALSNLQFKDCSGLRSLPESFGNLSALSNLKFEDCSGLGSLPESFGKLSALSNLKFLGCGSLHSLPESFGNLSKLSDLQFQSCYRLHSLPESFGNLSALSSLQFNNCESLSSLPESFGNLSALSSLQFNNCSSLSSLPESFGNLSALSSLQFYTCQISHSLPESFGYLSALSNLLFKFCDSLHSLPESFGNLSALSSLQFCNCQSLHSLPESFGNLSALSNLQFKDCCSLRSLPESFGKLSALSNLQFDNCESFRSRTFPSPNSSLHSLPKSFGNLSALNSLEFKFCSSLYSIPESFGQLSVTASAVRVMQGFA